MNNAMVLGSNPEGILISMLNARTNYAKDIMELIREYYGDAIPIFESKIPFSVKAAETWKI